MPRRATCSRSPHPGEGSGKGPGGKDDGGIEFVLEFKVDDIVDWLWEEMQLPNLKARIGKSEEADWAREGWDKRGARSRLDRRRSMRESIKRRTMQDEEAPTFTDDDLRFPPAAASASSRRSRPSCSC